jgi:D-sedoheptulose 7-phosphate isomerase
MDNKNKLIKNINESIAVKKSLLKNYPEINNAIKVIYKSLKENKKVFICGNGGSAADAQHLSAEFLVRLNPKINRGPFPIISLALDTSTITACANDYDFKYLFSRNLEALGNINDVLIAISTSGNSKNIIEVVKKAKKMKIHTIGFLGTKGGKVFHDLDNAIVVNSNNVARIQEAHIFIGHTILEQVEKLLLTK